MISSDFSQSFFNVPVGLFVTFTLVRCQSNACVSDLASLNP